MLPTDHGCHVVFDLNEQRRLIEAQFQRPAAEPAPPAHRPSLVLPTDVDGTHVIMDMHAQLRAIEAQFQRPAAVAVAKVPTPPLTPPPLPATTTTRPQVVHPQDVAHADNTPNRDLQELEENAQLLKQQTLSATIVAEETTRVASN